MKDIDIHVHVYDFVSLIKENIQCIFEWGTCMCAYKLYRTYTKVFFSTVYRNLGTNGIQLEAAINILYDSVNKYIFDHNYPEFSSQVRGIHGV